ncbi:MAG: hypothetical protein WC645_08035 [Candidatus Margulisiibacteriota bacterium]
MDINPIRYGFNLPPLQLDLPVVDGAEAPNPSSAVYEPTNFAPIHFSDIETTEPAETPEYSDVYMASTQNYGENIMEGGYLPINGPKFQLLLRYFQINNSAPPADPSQFYYPERYAANYGGGLQFRWLQPSGGSLYGRLQIADRETSDGTHRDSAIEFTYAELAEKFILRALIQTSGAEARLTDQFYARFPILDNDRLNIRLGIEYSSSTQADQSVTVLGKIDGTIRPDPWWGWNVQAFVPIPTNSGMVEEYPGPGLFFWTGFVHSESAFSEIMLYLNTRTLDDVRDVVGGLILKTKFGTEARWWPEINPH